MYNYEPLTKETVDSNGNKQINCILHGTEECRGIHKTKGCTNCPVFSAILTQLRIFEQVYIEGEEDEETNQR